MELCANARRDEELVKNISKQGFASLNASLQSCQRETRNIYNTIQDYATQLSQADEMWSMFDVPEAISQICASTFFTGVVLAKNDYLATIIKKGREKRDLLDAHLVVIFAIKYRIRRKLGKNVEWVEDLSFLMIE